MFVLGNFLAAAAKILDLLLTMYLWVIIIRAILSWVNPDPYNPIVRLLYQVTEPVLGAIRRRLPVGGFGIDFSPVIVIVVILFLQQFLVQTLIEIAVRMR